MDDLQNKINQIMSDPEALKQVQNLGEMLGLANGGSNASAAPPAPAPQVSAPPAPAPGPDLTSLLGGDGLAGITKLMPILQSIKQEDETTHLLLALRPFLSEPKKKKLDEAKKMLQMLKLLPLLKNNNLMNLF